MKETEIQKPIDKRVAERIATAKAAAEKMGRTFVASIFRTIATAEMVKICVPGPTAAHLQTVSDHKLLVFEGTALKTVVPVDVRAHYVHGDFTKRQTDGRIKPTVVRHFYVLPSFLGEEIIATVNVKEKTCLLTGEKMVIIDIIQVITNGKPVEVEYALRLGVPAKNQKGEILIPGTERCVRIEKIKAVKIAA